MSNSTKKPLQIKDLTIGEMPGFPSGMKPFKNFSDGINIIAGPNASGKSTTAHAIQKLIWQNETSRIKLSGLAKMNGDAWTLRVNSGQKIVQRNGVTDEISGVPAAEEQNRYMLALHKLMTADGKDLAKQIIRESVGGYDPEKAAEHLGYSSRVSTTGISTFKEFKNAEQAVRSSQQAQKAVKAEEKKLADLYGKKDEAEVSGRKAAFYKTVVETKKAEGKYTGLKTKLESFPEVLDHAHGEELLRVEELEREISAAEESIETASETIKKSNERLDQLTIPESGVPGKVIDELEGRAGRLETAERELLSFETEIKALERKRSEQIKRIGDHADPERLRELDLKDVGDLDKFLEEAHRLASEKRLAEQEIADLEKEGGKNPEDPDTVRQGITQLSYWLKELSEQREFPKWIILAIAALAILSAALGYFMPLAGAAGLAIILMLAVYGWIQLGMEIDNQSENIRIDDFGNTGLTAPSAWNADEVSARLDELISDLREARWNEKVNGKLESARKRLDNLNSRIKTTEKRKEELNERLSVLPEMPFSDPESYSQLAWYVSAVQDWQEADTNLLALNDKLDETRGQVEQELTKIADLIKPYTNDTAGDAAEAQAIYKNLSRQEEIRDRATEDIDRQQAVIAKEQNLIKKKSKDLTSVYEKFKLDKDEKDRLRQLIEQLDAYKRVKKTYELAKSEFENHSRTLEEHSLFEEERHHISGLSLDQAEDLLKELQEETEKLEPLRKEIADIEAKVNNVKSGNSLEKALSERDKTVENLKTHYEDNLQKLTGRLLADTIKEEMREQNRPKVFKEANRLFNRITKGRYELRMDEKDEPLFLAFDTVENIGRSLDQLSSGTRIQLLMAVRLAFVETQETSIKLPILADELLANSDDVRAEAIIEALTEISRDGRQVFYFTAQGDEVAKWENYLNRKGMTDHKVFYLTGGRSEAADIPMETEQEPIRLTREITEPGLLNHSQYGEVLNFPVFDPLMDEPEQLHLWYLLDDPNILYKALSSGIDYWGALKSYMNEGGIIEGLEEHRVRKMKEKADLLERYLQLYRQGRPRPIGRRVLEESGAVSDSFIEAVSKKLQELNGNPASLLQSLKNSEVSGFRTNKIEELEAYLLEYGYLDDRDPLDKDTMTVALQAFISNLDLSREEAERFLEMFSGIEMEG